MNDFESDLTLLENLSKKISDLIYNNQFTQISQIDKQRQAIIEKIKNSEKSHLQIESRISDLIINNNEMLKNTENKLNKLKRDHEKFNKRLKAYSLSKWIKSDI